MQCLMQEEEEQGNGKESWSGVCSRIEVKKKDNYGLRSIFCCFPGLSLWERLWRKGETKRN